MVTKVLIFGIFFWHYFLSKIAGQILGVNYICRFQPSCSFYTLWAIEKFGVAKGLKLGFLRLLQCHPFSAAAGDSVR